MHGYVQVYTGNGKGKTTAALGLALRAAGAGLRVLVAQFLKVETSEHLALFRFTDCITIKCYGSEFHGKWTKDDKEKVRTGYMRTVEAIFSGEYDVVVLDEVNVAMHLGIIDLDSVLRLIQMRPREVELVLTGRWAGRAVIEAADLVTQMNAVKHYHDRGVKARQGIED